MYKVIKKHAKSSPLKRGKSVSYSKKPYFAKSMDSGFDDVFHLQRTVGNRALRKIMEVGVPQPEPSVGRPNDTYEQEADRVAEQVTRMPDHGRSPSQNAGKRLQPVEDGRQSLEGASHLELHANSSKNGGHPLPGPVRRYFEPRFGHDFGDVRIHADSIAAKAAKLLNARAFTKGRDIVFGAGQYSPNTSAGKRLLAHELTHVVQQYSQGHRIQRQCNRAAGRVIFNLDASGIVTGHTHIRQGAQVDFQNLDNKPHTITIVPRGIFTSNRFVIRPGAKVIVWASGTSAQISGTILDNVPRGRSVHDITVCP